MPDHNEEAANALWIVGGIILFCGIVGSWIWYPELSLHFLDRFPRQSDIALLGPFGDIFGSLNALFTALAFFALVITLRLQSRELQMQRSELRGQKEALSSQNSTLERQNFDNRFFQMVRMQHDIANAIDLRGEDSAVTVQGRDCFATFYGRVESNWKA